MRLRLRWLAVLLALALPAAAQDRAGVQTAFARAQHLKRGINVSHWFSQNPSDYSAQHTNTETTTDDIALIAHLGFDNVRLSIDAVPLEQAPLGADGLNGDFLGRLDRAVDTMLADGLAVQIDLHPEDSYKQQLRTNDWNVDRLTMLWRKLAAHYAGRDPERVFFEILNEPEVGDPYRWAGIQARVAAAIREVAPATPSSPPGPITLTSRICSPSILSPMATSSTTSTSTIPTSSPIRAPVGASPGGSTSTASPTLPRKVPCTS